MISKTDRKFERDRRHIRVRRKISGTPECPRLCMYRSNTNIYAQIIDDEPDEEFIRKRVDPILDKIFHHGIQSLTPEEREILEKAQRRMRKN